MSLIALETNIFPIHNLSELTATYRLFLIRGLRPDQDEYFQNRQYLTKRLSYALKSPTLTIARGDETFLVVRDGVGPIPDAFPVVRGRVRFEPASEVLHLDFTKREKENDEICLRFLQFAVQEALYHHQSLWQPASGRPFYEYRPHRIDGNICHYRGFSLRIAPSASGELGVVVDVVTKSVSRTPLPAQMTRDSFRAWHSKTVVYRYGHQWYEIRLSSLDDRPCGEYEILEEGQWTNLLAFAIRKTRKPLPKELLDVNPNDSVVLYRNNQNQERGAIARLCYPVIGTDGGDAVATMHRESILGPDDRRNAIQTFAQTYLPLLRFGNTPLVISQTPEHTEVRMFNVPDQQFGQGRVISTVGTANATQVSLDHLGDARKALLRDSRAGFFSRSLLDRQYAILPKSAYQTYGSALLRDLAREVEQFYPHGGGYQPQVITYDDSGRRTFAIQGAAVLQALDAAKIEPGYALVMVHHTSNRAIRQEDPLAGMIIQKLRERFDVSAAVFHTKMAASCYVERSLPNGKREYYIDQRKRGRFAGYLRNVALNKILLTNQKWPFVLSTPLHADITIGIDIKQHTTGFVVVSDGGKNISTLIRTSRQKERLMHDQMRDYLIEVIAREAELQHNLIKTIVIHRDGRTFQTELTGMSLAMERLRAEGIIHADATITVLEIPKNSPIRLRLFDVVSDDDGERVENPQIGCYYIVDDRSAFICSTGRAFSHEGTTRPLAVRRVVGPLGIDECLQDLYALTSLAWSKPDDCSRYPITLKLCDRYLSEDATEYDEDALARAEALSELEVDSDDE